jgi:hypothetical protein
MKFGEIRMKISPLIICMILTVACSAGKKELKKDFTPAEGSDNLAGFFKLCERDIHRAVKAVIDRDLISILSHFQRMDDGGRKYYLLEKEGIAAMIMAVTEDIYEDFILINRHGAVIYSMSNVNVFSKRVDGPLRQTPLYDCFNKTGNDIFINDTVRSENLSENFILLISSRVIKDGIFQGIFVLQLNINKLEKLIDLNADVIDTGGIYRFSRNKNNILNSHPDYGKFQIELINLKEERIINAGRDINCCPFSFKNLRWIIISG